MDSGFSLREPRNDEQKRRSSWGGEGRKRLSSLRTQGPITTAVSWGKSRLPSSFRDRPRVWVPARARCASPGRQVSSTELTFPLRRLLDPLRHHVPVGGGAEALQDIHEAGVAADQDARLVLLDALDDPKRRILGRRLGDGVEPLDRLHPPLVV